MSYNYTFDLLFCIYFLFQNFSRYYIVEIGKLFGTYKHLIDLKTRAWLFKTTTLLVNVLLKFPMLKSEIRHYFLSKKSEKLLQCKSFSQFFYKKIQYI